MSLIYRATFHTITRDINDFADKCKRLGIDYAKINPIVEHDPIGDRINYLIDVSGVSSYGRKAKIAVVKRVVKNINTKKEDELRNLCKRGILKEVSEIEKYLEEKGIKSKISGVKLERYYSCMQNEKIDL
jgi:hypothetical protein